MLISRFKKCSTLILCVFIYCFTATVFSQNNDASFSQLDTISFKKSLEGKSLYKLVRVLFSELDIDSLKTKIIAKHIQRNFTTTKKSKEVAGAYITLSVWEDKRGNFEEAISLLDKGIQIANKIENDSILYIAYLRKGVTDYYHTNYESALKSYYKALEITKKNKNTKREIIIAGNIALVRMQANDTNGAIELLLENLKKIEKEPELINKSDELTLYVNLCGAYIYIEDYIAANPYCEKGLVLNKDINNSITEAHLLSAFAEIARDKKDFKECYDLLDKAEVLIEKSGGKENLRLFLKLYRAKAYYDEEKYQQAVDELLKIEEMRNEYDFERYS